ncbi:MAG: hypothetical protein Q9187_006823 [Circinaria calcarea]
MAFLTRSLEKDIPATKNITVEKGFSVTKDIAGARNIPVEYDFVVTAFFYGNHLVPSAAQDNNMSVETSGPYKETWEEHADEANPKRKAVDPQEEPKGKKTRGKGTTRKVAIVSAKDKLLKDMNLKRLR